MTNKIAEWIKKNPQKTILEAPVNIKIAFCEMKSIADEKNWLPIAIEKSKFSEFYKELQENNLSGYIVVKNFTIVGMEKFTPDDKKKKLRKLKQKYPEVFEKGMWQKE